MENKQYKLCVEVLRRMDKAGLLKEVILIGSWCVPFYKDYFARVKFNTAILTRDMDFLIPVPVRSKVKIDLSEALKDLGFIMGFQGEEGYIRLEHPELAIEFLVPETGRGSSKAYPLPMWGVNAQPLRYLNLLIQNVIQADIDGIFLNLPHPAIFAFHKLIVSQLRRKKDKALKDEREALEILRALVVKNEKAVIRKHFDAILPKWQKKIIKALRDLDKDEIIHILK